MVQPAYQDQFSGDHRGRLGTMGSRRCEQESRETYENEPLGLIEKNVDLGL